MRTEPTLKQVEAIQSKLRQQSKYSLADLLDQAKEIWTFEKMHKQGAYYGIEVETELGTIATVYISEKVWDVA